MVRGQRVRWEVSKMIPEEPDAKGWHHSWKGLKFHYFEGKVLWNLSLCRMTHIHISHLHLQPGHEVDERSKCKLCLRKLATR
ncbi:hypothetical protein LCGC14_0275590 [marine sediment metagenome]|uniref:Uncharacterized protein n=1 Tax=marine sediment metagenome TaxID=412755 RepID=A0A0F9U2F5_9ZZZZ